MQFTPKSAEEIAEANLFPKGEYPARVVQAVDTVSKKSGAEMIKLVVKVFGEGNRSTNVTAYLMGAMEAQLRHFCEATNQLAKYERGELTAADCEGRELMVKLKIEEDKSGQYGPKNVIADFVVDKSKRKPSAAAALDAKDSGVSDDDIPW